MKTSTDHPVHDLIAARWSPYSFSAQAVADDDLRSLFEAARWAPSSYNEQPWAFLVATKDDSAEFEKLLSCLVPANQAWARNVPVLALGLASSKFARNGNPNRHAFHDLGQAVANLSLEATSRGLCVHQMAGIDPDQARQAYGVPADWEVVTGIAVGYAGDAAALPVDVKQRDATRRGRKAVSEFVFSGRFGQTAAVVK